MGASITEAQRAPPPRATALKPSMDDKTHQREPAGACRVRRMVSVQLAPVVLVWVVVAVPCPAAGAESQSAVIAIGHTAERVGLGGQGRHVGSPGGAA